MKRILMLWLIGSVISSNAVATVKNDKDNDCAKFDIQISNLTNSVCVLTNQDVDHGNLLTPPPSSIPPSDSKYFKMEQTIYGPGIKLSYQCGGKKVTFTSKQNLCFMEAGSITGTVWSPLPTGINASFTSTEGSYFWSNSGSINWKITN